MENLNSEHFLLGCLLHNGDLIKEVSLEPDDFEDSRHRRIYTLMKSIDEKGEIVDSAALTIHAGSEILAMGGMDYFGELMNCVPSINNYKTYETYVRKESKLRKAKGLVQEIFNLGSIKDYEAIQNIIAEAAEVLESEEEKKFDLREKMLEIHDMIEQSTDRKIKGIATGFRDLDRLLEGWQKQDLNIIAARPSMGKTAFAMSLAHNAILAGEYVDIFSLEMSSIHLLLRMLSMVGRIESMKLKRAVERFSNEDWNKYTKAQGILYNWHENLYIYEKPSPSVQEIRNRVRQSVRDYPEKKHLVIIDYLTLIKGNGKDRTREIGEISRSIKQMARELDVSVLLLAQLNRSVEQRPNKRPMLSDIRDSGEVEQDADTISFLYRDDYYNAESESKNIVEVIIAKNRNGPIGTVELAFLKEYNAFLPLSREPLRNP